MGEAEAHFVGQAILAAILPAAASQAAFSVQA
jgi:hypothetical protein